MARRTLLVALPVLALLALAAGPATAANINSVNAFVVRNLQSDVPGRAEHLDPDLINGWGISAGPASGPATPWWVADNGTHKTTLYNGVTGLKQALIVDLAGNGGPADPTGTVFNTSTEFPVNGDPARFIFDGEDGAVSGWNGGTVSTVEATSQNGAIYKGLAIGSVTSGGTSHAYLYAADFHNNHVDVYDGTWTLKHWAGAFHDPNLPAGYAPFGIQNLNGEIFVTYAKQDPDRMDEVAGEGLGFVDRYGTDGSFRGRVASRGALNAPWGLAWAPAGWGRFGGQLLVGNFGNGRINVFRATSSGWEATGHLKTPGHQPIVIDGLWGIGFGNGGGAGPTNVLYFAAGPDDESHGLFGSISMP